MIMIINSSFPLSTSPSLCRPLLSRLPACPLARLLTRMQIWTTVRCLPCTPLRFPRRTRGDWRLNVTSPKPKSFSNSFSRSPSILQPTRKKERKKNPTGNLFHRKQKSRLRLDQSLPHASPPWTAPVWYRCHKGLSLSLILMLHGTEPTAEMEKKTHFCFSNKFRFISIWFL